MCRVSGVVTSFRSNERLHVLYRLTKYGMPTIRSQLCQCNICVDTRLHSFSHRSFRRLLWPIFDISMNDYEAIIDDNLRVKGTVNCCLPSCDLQGCRLSRPSLNLIERLWGHLKRTVIANVLFTTIDDFVGAFRRGVGHVNGHRSRMGFMFDHDDVVGKKVA